MRVIEPSQFQKPLKKKRPLRALLAAVLIILIAGYSALAYAKPLPLVSGVALTPKTATFPSPTLQWPKDGQAAFGAVGYGVLAQSGAQTTMPMASVAKVLTALTILQAKPLKPGQPGPTITLGQDDIDIYNNFVALGGSVVAVNAGETISQYQALQALLLPSANNMAESLARWAYGSTDAYLTHANQLATSLKLKQTHIADSSGLSPLTKSTPSDLVLLGIAALKNPVIAEIIGQKTANIPVAGVVNNTNKLLGQNAINGVKTGDTEQAGGCLLFSSPQTYSNGQRLTLVGAVMGLPSLAQTFPAAASLLRLAIPGFRVVAPTGHRTVVGSYKSAWGQTVTAVVTADAGVLTWSSQPLKLKINLDEIKAPVLEGSAVGSLSIEGAGVHKTLPITLTGDLKRPAIFWRLTHFFNG